MNIADKLVKGKSAVAVMGLGYVGFPIAYLYAKRGIKVIAFDVNPHHLANLRKHIDITGDYTKEQLKEVAGNITYTNNPSDLKKAGFFIVAVPTPIDADKKPDLRNLTVVSDLVGSNMQKDSYVVYESTVYPGVTEEVCLPILEKTSGLSLDKGDFFIGYSPERINPGDAEHTLEKTLKVVSGQNKRVCDEIARVYELVVKGGVFKAENIKVAEAAKVIENTQRDLNIALMNELSIIFHRIGVDTQQVLKAAGTKWNFLKFTPGLVGGHCIGVDPFYLTSKAEQHGYHPHVVLAGRRINDSMGGYVAQAAIKQMIKAGKTVQGAHVLVLGLAFKENVVDFRNSRVVDIIKELEAYGAKVTAHEPLIDDVGHEFTVPNTPYKKIKNVDCIILAVPHEVLKRKTLQEYKRLCRTGKGKPVFIDVRWVYSAEEAEKVGFHYWKL